MFSFIASTNPLSVQSFSTKRHRTRQRTHVYEPPNPKKTVRLALLEIGLFVVVGSRCTAQPSAAAVAGAAIGCSSRSSSI